MSQSDEESKPDPAAPRKRRFGVPLAAAAACLLAVGGYQLFYATKKHAYLIERNHRLLATQSLQIGQAIAAESNMLKVLSKLAGDVEEPQRLGEALRKLREQYEVKLDDAGPCSDRAPGGAGLAARAAADRSGAEPASAGRAAAGGTGAGRVEESAALVGMVAAPDGGYSLQFRYQQLCASVRLSELLRPLLASRKAFTHVLLADESGRVIYQQPEMNLRALDELASGAGAPPAKDGAPPAKDGAKAQAEGAGDSAQAALRSLTGASREVQVELRGRKLELFSQPVALPDSVVKAIEAGVDGQENDRPAGPAAAGANQVTRHSLRLFGLVATDELRYDSIALSPLVLGAATAVLLVALLSWPLVKLRLLGERQRLRLGDVVMVAVCSLLGVSWLTLSLLGLRQQWRLGRLADDQLVEFARQMAHNLEDEIQCGYAQLDILERAAASGAAATATPEQPERHANMLDPDPHGNPLAPSLLATYPFTESFTLLAADGRPALKWTTDNKAMLAPTSRSRDYFQRVLRRDLWQLPHARARRSSGGPSWCDAHAAGAGGLDTGMHGVPGPPGRFDPASRDRRGFVIESITSQISGVRQAVLARPSEVGPPGRFAVAALGMPMLSVIHPVLPPDVDFAVIDGHGTVLFHSDPARNMVENLFVETDRDKHLQAAVFARREATLDVSYWGESYRARVAPVDGPPWVVVALRLQGPLEMANVQAILVCLVFLLLVAGAFGLGLVALALLRPGYRPEWLWPSPERSNDYVRLSLVYLLLAVDLMLALSLLPGSGLLVGVGCLVALLALVLGYLQLTRRDLRPPVWAAWTAGLVALCWLLASLLAPERATSPRPHGVDSWLPLVLILPPVVAAAFLVLRKPGWWQRLTRRRRVAVAWAHPALGVLLLLLLSVLPTLAAWKTATTIAMDCFVKRGQLVLADRLEDQRARARRHYAEEWGRCKPILLDLRYGLADPPAADPCSATAAALRGPLVKTSDPDAAWGLDFYGRSFFATRVDGPEGENGKELHGLSAALPEFLEELLPVYSEYAVQTRELLHDRATDGGWHWDRRGDELILEKETLHHSLVSLPPPNWLTSSSSAAGLSSPASGAAGGDAAGAGLPPHYVQAGPAAGRSSAAGWAATAVAGALFLTVLAGLAGFISRRVFLVDLIEPLWSGGVGAVGSNLFLVNRRRDWPPRDPASFVRLHCKDLEQHAAGWPEKRLELQRSQPGRTALVEGFEHRIFDSEFNDSKLAFLEDLVQDRTVIVLSAVSPDLLLARPAAVAAVTAGGGPRPVVAPDTRERWRALLAAFTVIDEDMRPRTDEASLSNVTVFAWRQMQELLRQVRAEHAPPPRRDRQFTSALLAEECGDNPVLIQFGRELDPFAIGLDRRQLLEELGERAEAYYRSLWATCGEDEKLVLGHLAEDGLINEHDRRWVRRLMARGLIRRDPVFRLMNQTFRRFVLSPACQQEVLRLERRTGESPWDRFRRPFFATVAAGIVFFLATQKQLLDGTLAIAASVTAAVPVMAKVLDMVSGRRRGGAE
jgi:hypothetical protein